MFNVETRIVHWREVCRKGKDVEQRGKEKIS